MRNLILMKAGLTMTGGMRNLKKIKTVFNYSLMILIEDWVKEMEEEMRKMREEHEQHFKDFDKEFDKEFPDRKKDREELPELGDHDGDFKEYNDLESLQRDGYVNIDRGDD